MTEVNTTINGHSDRQNNSPAFIRQTLQSTDHALLFPVHREAVKISKIFYNGEFDPGSG